MKASEKEKLKIRVLELLKKTAQSIQDLRERTKPIPPDNSLGRLTRMEAINELNVQKESLRQAEQRESLLNKVLSRIESPEFGECQECGGPISFKRLFSVPYGLICIECLKENSE